MYTYDIKVSVNVISYVITDVYYCLTVQEPTYRYMIVIMIIIIIMFIIIIISCSIIDINIIITYLIASLAEAGHRPRLGGPSRVGGSRCYACVCIYIYIHIHICICICVYIYIYIYIYMRQK